MISKLETFNLQFCSAVLFLTRGNPSFGLSKGRYKKPILGFPKLFWLLALFA